MHMFPVSRRKTGGPNRRNSASLRRAFVFHKIGILFETQRSSSEETTCTCALNTSKDTSCALSSARQRRVTLATLHYGQFHSDHVLAFTHLAPTPVLRHVLANLGKILVDFGEVWPESHPLTRASCAGLFRPLSGRRWPLLAFWCSEFFQRRLLPHPLAARG